MDKLICTDEVLLPNRWFQCRPQSISLWYQPNIAVTTRMGFKVATHKPFIYREKWKDEVVLINIQVYQFSMTYIKGKVLMELIYNIIQKISIL